MWWQLQPTHEHYYVLKLRYLNIICMQQFSQKINRSSCYRCCVVAIRFADLSLPSATKSLCFQMRTIMRIGTILRGSVIYIYLNFDTQLALHTCLVVNELKIEMKWSDQKKKCDELFLSRLTKCQWYCVLKVWRHIMSNNCHHEAWSLLTTWVTSHEKDDHDGR